MTRMEIVGWTILCLTGMLIGIFGNSMFCLGTWAFNGGLILGQILWCKKEEK